MGTLGGEFDIRSGWSGDIGALENYLKTTIDYGRLAAGESNTVHIGKQAIRSSHISLFDRKS